MNQTQTESKIQSQSLRKPEPDIFKVEMTEDERQRLILWLGITVGAVMRDAGYEGKAILNFVDSKLRR